MSLTFIPFRLYSPRVGVSRHPRMFISVDLPDPDGPIRATNSPFLICRETDFKAWMVFAPITYLRPISVICIREGVGISLKEFTVRRVEVRFVTNYWSSSSVFA